MYDEYTHGIGIGIGRGNRIFFPPLRSIAVKAAFLSNFFFPASTSLGAKRAAKMTDRIKNVDKTLKYFILIESLCLCVCF